jgi:hypothetical protein
MNGLTEVDAYNVTIHDIRNVENDFTLVKNGLQVWDPPSEPECTKDEDEVMAKYYPEVVAYLKICRNSSSNIQYINPFLTKLYRTGASKVYIFMHVIHDVLENDSNRLGYENGVPYGPAPRPHCVST